MRVDGLDDDERAIYEQLWTQLSARLARNMMLDAYYDSHRAFRDLGISVPPQMFNTRAALGWPAKAVQALARKHVFEGYTVDGQTDLFDVSELLARNCFDVDLAQAITACYRHGCSFISVTAGDETAGEPPVLIQARDAEWCTARWNHRLRRIDAALEITDIADDPTGFDSTWGFTVMAPSGFILHTDDRTVVARLVDGRWEVTRRANPAGRIMVEMLVNDPQIPRPFGSSRITREVRYLTDAAIRTLVRTETSAEFFSSPQRYVLGVDPDVFDGDDRWSAIMGRILALTPNEDGEIPQVGQFAQMSMEPHLSMYRQLAQNFCAATGLPQSSVGLFADNPASAEAMQAAEVHLSDQAEYQWRVFSPALARVIQDVIMIRDRLTAPPDDSWRMSLNWTPARYVSPQASSDFIVKTVQALPRVADTTVALRRAGFTQPEIEQMQGEWRRSGVHDLLESLSSRPEPTDDRQG